MGHPAGKGLSNLYPFRTQAKRNNTSLQVPCDLQQEKSEKNKTITQARQALVKQPRGHCTLETNQVERQH